MSKYKALGTFSIVAAMMFTGCGPTGGDGDGGNNTSNNTNNTSNNTSNNTGGTVTQEQFKARAGDGTAKLLCRAVFGCPEQASELLFVAGRYPDQTSCEQNVLNDLGADLFVSESAGVDAGRLVFDASAAATCLSDIEGQFTASACSIDFGESLSSSCDVVFVGQVAADGNCASEDECTDGLSCVYETDACYGSCKPDLCNGEACESGEFCDFGSNEGESCAPKLKEGDACTFSDDCTLESDDVDCLPSDADSFDGTCTKYGTVADGGFCDSDSDFCVSGFRCDFDTETCVSSGGGITLGEMGEDCDLENSPCGPGLACTDLDFAGGSGGKCGTPKTTGGECYIPFECEPSLTCVGVNFEMNPPQPGACGPRFANGQSCNDDMECMSSNCSEDGKCSDPMACVVP